jgi:hypothetical protein
VSADNEGDGVATPGTSASLHFIRNCFITGASLTNGINISGTGKAHIANNRIRGAATSIVGSLEYCDIPYWDNTDDAGTDTDEYVNAASGDYRIKNTSTYWGRGFGAGDEPAAGGGRYTRGRWAILSTPLKGDEQNSSKHKDIWLDNLFGYAFGNDFNKKRFYSAHKWRWATAITNIEGDKTYVQQGSYGRQNLLIDDRPTNLEEFENKGGLTIRYQANESKMDNLENKLIHLFGKV